MKKLTKIKEAAKSRIIVKDCNIFFRITERTGRPNKETQEEFRGCSQLTRLH
jgi:hypothetical protein